MDEDQDERNEKQDKSMLDAKDLLNDRKDRKIENDALEDKRQLTSTDGGASEKPVALKEQAIVNHEGVLLDKCNDPSNSKSSNDQAPSTVQDSNGSTSKVDIPATSEESGERTLIKEPCQPAQKIKDGHVVSDSLPSEKNRLEQSITANIAEAPKSVKTPKDMEVVSDSVPSNKSNPQKPLSNIPVGDRMESTDPVMSVDMVSNSLPSEKSESQPLFTSYLSQHSGMEKDVDMSSSVPLDKNEPSHAVTSKSGAENGGSAGLSLSLSLTLSQTNTHTRNAMEQ